MSRRSITAKAQAEQSFAVRVHLITPEGGFAAHNQLEALLRERLGKSFHLGSERGFGNGTDSIVVYANDLGAITDIVHRLGCEINRVRHSVWTGASE